MPNKLLNLLALSLGVAYDNEKTVNNLLYAQNMTPVTNKILFLFGAGASIPAGVKSTNELTTWLVDCFKQDPFLRQHEWLPSLWEVIKHHAMHSSFAMGPYEPNFEHLVYAIELLKDYTDVFRLPDKKYWQTIEEFGSRANLPNAVEAYAATAYALLPITMDSRRTNPVSRQISFKGASAKYMWVGKAIRRLIADKISTSYTFDHLRTFEEVFRQAQVEYTIATTNYDLVFEEYLYKAGMELNDGFSKDREPSQWQGIFDDEKRITFLKLHGSLNWFKIRQDWFRQILLSQSSNDIYKVNGSTCRDYLKSELAEKGESDQKYKYEFDIPHIVLGGNKDSKILDAPYIDIHRQWLSDLSVAKTIVLIGVGGFDFHLLQQMRGLITTNPNLEKILLVDPNYSSHERISSFIDMKRIHDRVKLFHVECGWDLSNIKEQYKLSFCDMVHMSSSQLHSHYTQTLNKGK